LLFDSTFGQIPADEAETTEELVKTLRGIIETTSADYDGCPMHEPKTLDRLPDYGSGRVDTRPRLSRPALRLRALAETVSARRNCLNPTRGA